MAEQELTSVIDNFESQLSLLRKAIKKESVKRSTADKIVLNIYNATRGFSLKDLMSACSYVRYIKIGLKNITKETDKALKNKKLRSEGLVTMSNYFKGVIKELGSIPQNDSIDDLKNKIDDVDIPANACPSHCLFKEGMNGLVGWYHCEWTKIKKCSKKEDEMKINFISNIIRAVNCLRKACKVHLNKKRSEINKNELCTIKTISGSLSDLRKEVIDVKYNDANSAYAKFTFSEDMSDENKEKIKQYSIKFCTLMKEIFGDKKSYYLKKYVSKKELSTFIKAYKDLYVILILLAKNLEAVVSVDY